MGIFKKKQSLKRKELLNKNVRGADKIKQRRKVNRVNKEEEESKKPTFWEKLRAKRTEKGKEQIFGGERKEKRKEKFSAMADKKKERREKRKAKRRR